jgi:hypothetical protein
MENVGMFYGHLKYITAFWHISCLFGNFVVIWYIFPGFGTLCREKSGNTRLTSHQNLSELDGRREHVNKQSHCRKTNKNI